MKRLSSMIHLWVVRRVSHTKGKASTCARHSNKNSKQALKNGEIAGAAMDVYEHEPQIHPELLKLDNVVLSPHTGTGTWEGRIAMCENVCDNILAWERKDIEGMDIVV